MKRSRLTTGSKNALGCNLMKSSARGGTASEPVNESGSLERAAKTCPLKAQMRVVPGGTACICNAVRARIGGSSGRVGFVHRFSDHSVGGLDKREPPRQGAMASFACRELSVTRALAAPVRP